MVALGAYGLCALFIDSRQGRAHAFLPDIFFSQGASECRARKACARP